MQIPPLRYAPVGMTKGEAALSVEIDLWMMELQIPPLRYAPVGMTKGGAALSVGIGLWMMGTADPSGGASYSKMM
jgi:hypothetical protein